LESKHATCPHVKGNLKKHLKFWEEVGTSKFILDVIDSGFEMFQLCAQYNIKLEIE